MTPSRESFDARVARLRETHTVPDPDLFGLIGAGADLAVRETVDELTAAEAADEAIGRVAANTDPAWMSAALRALRHVASMMPEFTAEDVWDRLDTLDVPPPHERRAMGAILREGVESGIIASTGRFDASKRAQGHGHPTSVWRAL